MKLEKWEHANGMADGGGGSGGKRAIVERELCLPSAIREQRSLRKSALECNFIRIAYPFQLDACADARFLHPNSIRCSH